MFHLLTNRILISSQLAVYEMCRSPSTCVATRLVRLTEAGMIEHWKHLHIPQAGCETASSTLNRKPATLDEVGIARQDTDLISQQSLEAVMLNYNNKSFCFDNLCMGELMSRVKSSSQKSYRRKSIVLLLYTYCLVPHLCEFKLCFCSRKYQHRRIVSNSSIVQDQPLPCIFAGSV